MTTNSVTSIQRQRGRNSFENSGKQVAKEDDASSNIILPSTLEPFSNTKVLIRDRFSYENFGSNKENSHRSVNLQVEEGRSHLVAPQIYQTNLTETAEGTNAHHPNDYSSLTEKLINKILDRDSDV